LKAITSQANLILIKYNNKKSSRLSKKYSSPQNINKDFDKVKKRNRNDKTHNQVKKVRRTSDDEFTETDTSSESESDSNHTNENKTESENERKKLDASQKTPNKNSCSLTELVQKTFFSREKQNLTNSSKKNNKNWNSVIMEIEEADNLFTTEKEDAKCDEEKTETTRNNKSYAKFSKKCRVMLPSIDLKQYDCTAWPILNPLSASITSACKVSNIFSNVAATTSTPFLSSSSTSASHFNNIKQTVLPQSSDSKTKSNVIKVNNVNMEKEDMLKLNSSLHSNKPTFNKVANSNEKKIYTPLEENKKTSLSSDNFKTNGNLLVEAKSINKPTTKAQERSNSISHLNGDTFRTSMSHKAGKNESSKQTNNHQFDYSNKNDHVSFHATLKRKEPTKIILKYSHAIGNNQSDDDEDNQLPDLKFH
jgi:hypothetical protein